MSWITKTQAMSESDVAEGTISAYIKQNLSDPLLIKKDNFQSYTDKKTGDIRYNFKYLINSEDWFSKFPTKSPVSPPLEANKGDTGENRGGDSVIAQLIEEKDRSIAYFKSRLEQIETDRIDYLKNRLEKTEDRVDQIYNSFLEFIKNQNKKPLLDKPKNEKEKPKEDTEAVEDRANSGDREREVGEGDSDT